jgi:hypothetical protein
MDFWNEHRLNSELLFFSIWLHVVDIRLALEPLLKASQIINPSGTSQDEAKKDYSSVPVAKALGTVQLPPGTGLSF